MSRSCDRIALPLDALDAFCASVEEEEEEEEATGVSVVLIHVLRSTVSRYLGGAGWIDLKSKPKINQIRYYIRVEM